MPSIKKVAVIGAGVMGAAIAAHMANIGLETELLDIVPLMPESPDKKNGPTSSDPAFRNRLGAMGLQKALKSRPPSFFLPEDAKLVRIGNLEDHPDRLADADWIIEAVVEDLAVKKALFYKISPFVNHQAVVSSNTSGIRIRDISEALPADLADRFLGIHFFNPPRYMKLIELIPGPLTRPDILELMASFCESRLGKGVVTAKDTPNFIANRIGVFSVLSTIRAMQEQSLTFEDVDELTGKVIGRPKSATFRTADVVGLDTLVHVAKNVHQGAVQDERREMFEPPEFMLKMIERRILGEKAGSGFYKRVKHGDEAKILVLDPISCEYRPRNAERFESLQSAKALADPGDRLASLYYAEDRAGRFIFQIISELLVYSAHRIPEICDDIFGIDNAMKWGFGWELGPFEIWDKLGLEKSLVKMQEAGYHPPAWVKDMERNGQMNFYRSHRGERFCYEPASLSYRQVPIDTRTIILPSLRERKRIVHENSGAALYDLGDGVAGLEFRTKMNVIDTDVIVMLKEALSKATESFDGLVIGHGGDNFCVGANLYMVLSAAMEKRWEELSAMVQGLQQTLMAMKYFEKPIVAAPAGLALGGGCEICLHAHRIRAAAETYMGLVEIGVGLIPSGGGCKELVLRGIENLFMVSAGGVYNRQIELKPFIARAFENIALAKVSTSAREAKKLGFMRLSDPVSINRDFLLYEAKNTVRAMLLEGFTAARPRDDIRVMGRDGLAFFEETLYVMHRSGYISAYDRELAGKIAYVLCGGNVFVDTTVSEDYLLELEREAFLSLCGQEKSQARMAHMLKTGKPLRN